MIPFRFGRYFWSLFVINAMLMALLLSVCVWVILGQFNRYAEAARIDHLTGEATALALAVGNRLDRAHADELAALANDLGGRGLNPVRVTFVLADGKVVGDSAADPNRMGPHGDRPEIREAMASGVGRSERWSHTVDRYLYYVAVRVGSADAPGGVVRVATAAHGTGTRANATRRVMITAACVGVGAGVVLALALAQLWSGRIGRVTRTAMQLARGDLSARVHVSGRDEVALLGRILNTVQQRISGHLRTIDRQRRTLDSLIAQLGEGVIVADANGRIALFNREAERLLHVAPPRENGSFTGLTVEQCVPHHRLQQMLLSLPRLQVSGDRDSADDPVDGAPQDRQWDQEATMKVDSPVGTRSILARTFEIRLPSTERSPAGHWARPGRALILTDVTELTRVMEVKADLAANASHELRTPLSAMRAALDTLRDVDLERDPAAVAGLIDIFDRHSARMEATIADLLELSRLESGSAHFVESPVSSRTLLEELRTEFAEPMRQKDLHWHAEIPDGDVTFAAKRELVRLILRNLVDNAVRFNRPGGDVRLSVHRENGVVVFDVVDTGCGIAPQEQHRVFERFYQTQRARSGPDRGTGLGLSIVRHAAKALNARIKLDSALGRGTCVTVRVPTGGPA